MPIYEYLCNSCRKRFSKLWKTISASQEASCPHCGSGDLQRLISRVAVIRSEESRLDNLADPSNFGDLDESDPRSLARWMKKMGQETGEDLGEEFNEVVERLEAGESPDQIEGSMPDPGGEDAWGGGGSLDDV
ncbi:MAG: zinc ribbon domain-containing protein [Candidatus Tectomicrobia bacterium]|uniref:Zinc ribbon domain-containing protein n=1 Tax=Tectimicrobiota bacterium TaxID=2528274 RepID=A0A932CNX7_UNCTE|nr:zinc ribbon domain-containing protein [Candidatus Tectomicrobia bacterium]